MPIQLETKFDVGAVVWRADIRGKRQSHPCPDCLGQRSWQAISPAGRGYTFECPRCARGHISDRALDLNFFTYVPDVCKRTLVAFRGIGDRGAEWFAAEDSSGGASTRSGTIHSENDLFATETEALEVARQKAFAATDRHQTQPSVAEGRALRLRVCDYQIDQAKLTADQKRLWSYEYKVDDCLSELEERLDSTAAPRPEWVREVILSHFPGRER